MLNQESTIIDILETVSRKVLFFLYSWLSRDGEVLAYILAVVHILLGVLFGVLIAISYTIYPSLWLKCVLFVLLFCFWIQHVFFNICFLVAAERKLIPDKFPYYDLIRSLTGIDHYSVFNNFIYAEGLGVLFLGLGVINQFSMWLHNYYKIDM
jgi:hypothetical protein